MCRSYRVIGAPMNVAGAPRARQNSRMQTRTFLLWIAGASLAVLSLAPVVSTQSDEEHGEEPELAIAMSQLQYFTHKLALSIEARNAELARFYLHETEETAESIRDGIPEYEGMRIGALVGSMLMPHVERLEELLANPDWDAVDRALATAVDSCNACHVATEHGFIVIEFERGANPYLQSFAPRAGG
nr:hypothetical protein [Gammaproteobacteria bacterium]